MFVQIFVLFCGFLDLANCNLFTLRLLHTNDIHARIDPVDLVGSSCPQQNFSGCYGGVSRQRALVKRVRDKFPNSTLYLDAGDYAQGTLWYTIYHSKFLADVLNRMQPDAWSLGNHEFDEKSQGMVNLLSNLRVPVVACNVDFSQEPLLKNYALKPSVVLNRAGYKIGIIGYLTPNTVFQSIPSKQIKFTDEIECIRKEAKKLKSEGVNVIIALGHSGYEKDQEIAKSIEEVSLVVGGHSHTFLSNDHNSKITPKGPYPTVVIRSDGSKCPVVQAYWLGVYMGNLTITFDSDTGRATEWEGGPILLNDSFPSDPDMDQFLAEFRPRIEDEANRIIGSTSVFLDSEMCSKGECNIGNLITDSMVEWYLGRQLPSAWNVVSAAIVNTGGIRSSINERNRNGVISYSDLAMVLPFQNNLVIMKISGSALIDLMESSANSLLSSGGGGFLQVSGLRVVFDTSKTATKRVVSLKVRCRHCRTPKYEPVESDNYYNIAASSFITNGGDNLKLNLSSDSLYVDESIDINVTQIYLQKQSPVWTDIQERIRLVDGADGCIL